MKIYHLISGLLKVNSYFLVNENTKEAVAIDCGENYNLIKETENKNGFHIKYLLLTHDHFDHAGNAKKLQDDGVKVYISAIDAAKLNGDGNLAAMVGKKFQSFTPDYCFSDGEELDLCGIKIKVMITPGHTDGSACFIVDRNIFSGDTLFYQSVGRTDFIGGNRADMINSVKKLAMLDGDYNVYPGHGAFTTLSHERQFNRFIEYEK